MSERRMSVCDVTGTPIVGQVWTVTLEGPHGERTTHTMCAVHGRTTHFGRKMVELLGWTHPTVERLIADLERIMDGPCPMREGYTLPEPCSSGTSGNPLRGSPAVSGAGHQTGSA